MNTPEDERLAGDRDFVIEALSKIPRTRGGLEHIKTTRPGLEMIFEEICKSYALKPQSVLSGRRGEQCKQVRADFCLKANGEFACTIKELSEFLDIHASNVIRAMK